MRIALAAGICALFTASRGYGVPPVLLEVTPDTLLPGTNHLVLWAIAEGGDVGGAWCVVTPPDWDGQSERPVVDLVWEQKTQRYESWYYGFTVPGAYLCTFYARNVLGEPSAPLRSTITRGDEHEPDDSPSEAPVFPVGGMQRRDLHGVNDADWVTFYGTTGLVYEVRTVQVGELVDTVLNLFYEHPDGRLSHVFEMNEEPAGAKLGETLLVEYPETCPSNGTYYVRVTGVYGRGRGSDGEYDLGISVPSGQTPWLIVLAGDGIHGTAVPDAYAIVDGVHTQAFASGSIDTAVELDPGTYTVRVASASGYLAMEDPNAVEQLADPLSEYGHPKTVEVRSDNAGYGGYCAFKFVPWVRIEAEVRDAWTGDPVESAALQFEALDGSIAGSAYDGYPHGPAHPATWFTLSDGAFPSDVLLPTVDWDMAVGCDGYVGMTEAAAVTGPSAGDVLDLGTIYLEPIDENGNGVDDRWEDTNFPETVFDPEGDPDHDGSDNEHEYRCGTDPHDWNSVLSFIGCESTASGPEVVWRTVPERWYQILARDDPGGTPTGVHGPVQAGSAETTMSWTDPVPGVPVRFYLVGTVLPPE